MHTHNFRPVTFMSLSCRLKFVATSSFGLYLFVSRVYRGGGGEYSYSVKKFSFWSFDLLHNESPHTPACLHKIHVIFKPWCAKGTTCVVMYVSWSCAVFNRNNVFMVLKIYGFSYFLSWFIRRNRRNSRHTSCSLASPGLLFPHWQVRKNSVEFGARQNWLIVFMCLVVFQTVYQDWSDALELLTPNSVLSSILLNSVEF